MDDLSAPVIGSDLSDPGTDMVGMIGGGTAYNEFSVDHVWGNVYRCCADRPVASTGTVYGVIKSGTNSPKEFTLFDMEFFADKTIEEVRHLPWIKTTTAAGSIDKCSPDYDVSNLNDDLMAVSMEVQLDKSAASVFTDGRMMFGSANILISVTPNDPDIVIFDVNFGEWHKVGLVISKQAVKKWLYANTSEIEGVYSGGLVASTFKLNPWGNYPAFYRNIQTKTTGSYESLKQWVRNNLA